MVQAAPNESTVRGTITGSRPDPVRPGWVQVQLAVTSAEPVEGDRLPALTAGQDLLVSLPAAAVEGLGQGESIVASVRMTGPGEYLARDIAPAPVPEEAASDSVSPRGEHERASEEPSRQSRGKRLDVDRDPPPDAKRSR
jgi:hypothetical protein